MDSYEVIRNIHKIGHLISGKVIKYEIFEDDISRHADIELETDSEFKSTIRILPLENDEQIPKIGSTINAVIVGHGYDTLYLSVDKKDFENVEDSKLFYQTIDNLKENEIIEGTVLQVRSFGIFIDLSLPFLGLIDIGHIDFNKGERLPRDFSEKFREGDKIKCIVSYFRFHERQIGLGYLPK
jgi:ribosomal protein S1